MVCLKKSSCLPHQVDMSLLHWDLEYCWNVTESYLLLGDVRDMLNPVSVQPKKKLIFQFNFSLEKKKTKRNLLYDNKNLWRFNSNWFVLFHIMTRSRQTSLSSKLKKFFSNHKVHWRLVFKLIWIQTTDNSNRLWDEKGGIN